MSVSLFQITDDIAWLERYLEECDDEGKPFSEDEAAKVSEYLESLDGKRNEKLDAYAYLVRKMEAEANTAADEYRYWREKAESRKRRVDWLKGVLRGHLQAVGQRKVATGRFNFSLCKNGGHAPLDIDAQQLPEEFFYRPPALPSTERIREAMKRGETVPGVEELPRGEHVRIR